MKRTLLTRLAIAVILAVFGPSLRAENPYFPAAGAWTRKLPIDLGMDAGKLRDAVAYAGAHGSSWDFGKDQVRTFGIPLGPVPATRAATNGLIIRHGYIVAEFGDTKA